ncbi:hypothetical protein AB0M28_23355 [Streptomyces sp. NPDC051940]|uniref:hypothetical protein n=1 Tax=Streptomyces sp. NPDC051940 TaxID=3155675 RepID=UPI003419F365
MAERNPAGDPEETRAQEPAPDDAPAAEGRTPAAEGRTPADGVPEPLDEEAAWAQIVASFGEEAKEPPHEPPGGASPADTPDHVRSITVLPAGSGPRDWGAAESSDDDFDESDEGHFVQPDPELPEADTTAKFAWIAVLGGPLLLIVLVLLGEPITWFWALLGIGGFFGGFATLIARMRPGGEDDDDLPGGGAVV